MKSKEQIFMEAYCRITGVVPVDGAALDELIKVAEEYRMDLTMAEFLNKSSTFIASPQSPKAKEIALNTAKDIWVAGRFPYAIDAGGVKVTLVNFADLIHKWLIKNPDQDQPGPNPIK